MKWFATVRFGFADEPTSALDILVQASVLDLLREVTQALGATVVIGGGIAVAWAAAWSQGITLTDYTAGPRSLFATFSTLVLVILFIAWIVSCLALILQVCAVMSLAAEGRFNHMGFGAVAIGLVLLYIVDQVLSGIGTFFMPFSMTPDGQFSTEVMWTSYRATLGTDGYPNVWGMGACILVPLFALFLAVCASRSIEKRTSLR